MERCAKRRRCPFATPTPNCVESSVWLVSLFDNVNSKSLLELMWYTVYCHFHPPAVVILQLIQPRLQALHGLQSPASSLKPAARLVLATWCYCKIITGRHWDQGRFLHHETFSKFSQIWFELICAMVCLVLRVEELPLHTSTSYLFQWEGSGRLGWFFCQHYSLQESQHLGPATFMI